MLASAAATLRDGEPPVPDGAKVVFYATVESEVRSLLLKQETIHEMLIILTEGRASSTCCTPCVERVSSQTEDYWAG
jgi:hypothetical protein